jgi:hypothetical protein
MNLSKEQIRLVEELGFELGESKYFEKQGDYETFYLIVKESGFFLEVQQTLIESDGTFYTDYYKEYPEEGQSLNEFLTNFFK